ncbi:MAG: hypothetical protein JNL90_00755 [Planctomycetes bacterium]|nr:hypothetical protein [Planctomycetota bacterium]
MAGRAVDFWLVYLREAHAVDSAWPMATPDGTVMEEPQTLEERAANARHCKTALGLEALPALIDTLDDQADRAYEAWPDRLVLIDPDGKVAWRSGPGPFGFDLPGFRAAIAREVKRLRRDAVEGAADEALAPETPDRDDAAPPADESRAADPDGEA